MWKGISLAEVRDRSRRQNAEVNNRVHWFASKTNIYFSYVFINLGISADGVTIIFFLVGLSGALMTVFGGTTGIILAYACWRLHIIIDMSDGDVARFHKSFTHRGKYWDAMIHSILNPLYSFMIPLSCYFSSTDIDFVILGVVLMFTQSILLATKYNFQKDRSNTDTPNSHSTPQQMTLKRRVINLSSEVAGMEGFILLSLLSYGIMPPDFQKALFGAYATLNALISGVKFYQLSYYGKTYSKLGH